MIPYGRQSIDGENSRLVLGTAQLSMPYGIRNVSVKPDGKVARRIVQAAWDSGINEFDTGQAYGNSEEILGLVFKRLGISKIAKVISKPHPQLDHLNPGVMLQALEETLARLGQDNLFCYMLHREDFLDLWEYGLGEIFEDFISKALVETIGISVYSPARALQALRSPSITFIQLPTNILDRRFEQAGVFNLAEALGKTIYIRSIFLKGLILMDSQKLPKKLEFASAVLNDLNLFSKDCHISKKALALGYLKATKPHARIIFGAKTPQQVLENCAVWGQTVRTDTFQDLKRIFSSVDKKILSPNSWEL
jgi:aryl-alcohol dehydrogenase-like predicted oxidoreductase